MPKQVQKFTKFTSTLLTIQETTCANSVSDEWDSDDDDSDVDSPQDLTQAVFCYKMDCSADEMFACNDEFFAFDDDEGTADEYVFVDQFDER